MFNVLKVIDKIIKKYPWEDSELLFKDELLNLVAVSQLETENKLIQEIEEMLVKARKEHQANHEIAPNSYGAGETFGEVQGLRRVLAILKKEEFEY